MNIKFSFRVVTFILSLFSISSAYANQSANDYDCIDSYRQYYLPYDKKSACSIPYKNSYTYYLTALDIYNKGVALAENYNLTNGKNNALKNVRILRHTFNEKMLSNDLHSYIKHQYINFVKSNNHVLSHTDIKKTLIKLGFLGDEMKSVLSGLPDFYTSHNVAKKVIDASDYGNFISFKKGDLSESDINLYIYNHKNNFFSVLALSQYYFKHKKIDRIESLLNSNYLGEDNKRMVFAFYYMLNNKCSNALKKLDSIDIDSPKWKSVRSIPLSLYASIHLKKNQFEKSFTYYKALVDNHPYNSNYWLGLAISAENTHQLTLAKQAYLQTARISSNKKTIHYSRLKLTTLL